MMLQVAHTRGEPGSQVNFPFGAPRSRNEMATSALTSSLPTMTQTLRTVETSKVLFRWTKEGDLVSVVGSWNGWGKPLPLASQRDAFGRGHLLSRMLDLPLGRHHFKFIVDGDWKYEPSYCFESDAYGNINNYIDIKAEDICRIIEPKRMKDWVSMTGPEAHHKWDRASEAWQKIHRKSTSKDVRTENQEVLINTLSLHERQQLVESIAEYGIDVAGASTTRCAYRGLIPRRKISGGSVAELSSKENGDHLIKVEEDGDTSSTKASSASTTTPPHYPQENGNGDILRLAGQSSSLSPPPLKPSRSVSRRRGSNGAGGSGNRLIRSRSLTDLENIQSEYSNNSVLFTLLDKKKSNERRPSLSQTKQDSSCAAVGSCLVNSSVRREGKLLLCMVGLPGRGKTHIARAIKRHLEWLGMKVGYFSSTDQRRKTLGEKISPDFFDPTDAEAWLHRGQIAAQVLNDAIEQLKSSIDIAVFDAANCTRNRRKWLADSVAEAGLYAQVIFIESICTSPEIFESNIHQTILRSPEYRDMSQADAMADFHLKNQHYMSIYETVQESEDFPFVKLVDVGRKIVSFRIGGYIPGRIMLLLANIHIQPRPIWFSRHGESQYNAQGRIGGDSPLSPRGMIYATKLDEFIRSIYHPKTPGEEADPSKPELIVWTSTLLRTGMTVGELNKSWEVIKWKCLDEIDAGMCDGLTYDEVAQQFPEEYKKRKEDKFNYSRSSALPALLQQQPPLSVYLTGDTQPYNIHNYRYPRGESYQDVFLRLEPVIFEMMRTTSPLLVVGHQAILRILYGYLTGRRPEECCDLPVPLHTVIQLTPQAFGTDEVWHSLAKETDGGDI